MEGEEGRWRRGESCRGEGGRGEDGGEGRRGEVAVRGGVEGGEPRN